MSGWPRWGAPRFQGRVEACNLHANSAFRRSELRAAPLSPRQPRVAMLAFLARTSRQRTMYFAAVIMAYRKPCLEGLV